MITREELSDITEQIYKMKSEVKTNTDKINDAVAKMDNTGNAGIESVLAIEKSIQNRIIQSGTINNVLNINYLVMEPIFYPINELALCISFKLNDEEFNLNFSLPSTDYIKNNKLDTELLYSKIFKEASETITKELLKKMDTSCLHNIISRPFI